MVNIFRPVRRFFDKEGEVGIFFCDG